MLIEHHDTSSAFLEKEDTQSELFTAGSVTTYPEGLVLGRLTADSKMVPYDPVASDGSEVPVAVLLNELVADAAADFRVGVLVRGRTVFSKTLVWAGGTPVPMTPAQTDALRSFDIYAEHVEYTSGLDNS